MFSRSLSWIIELFLADGRSFEPLPRRKSTMGDVLRSWRSNIDRFYCLISLLNLTSRDSIGYAGCSNKFDRTFLSFYWLSLQHIAATTKSIEHAYCAPGSPASLAKHYFLNWRFFFAAFFCAELNNSLLQSKRHRKSISSIK